MVKVRILQRQTVVPCCPGPNTAHTAQVFSGLTAPDLPKQPSDVRELTGDIGNGSLYMRLVMDQRLARPIEHGKRCQLSLAAGQIIYDNCMTINTSTLILGPSPVQISKCLDSFGSNVQGERMPDLISKATRNRFCEALVRNSVLREIEMIFDEAGLEPDLDFVPRTSGDRRTLIEQYYAGVDFSSWADVSKMVTSFAEVVLLLTGRGDTSAADDLTERMHKDGFVYESGTFSRRWDDQTPLVTGVRAYAALRNLPELNAQIDRLYGSIDTDPRLAIGTAKELIETVCKTILDDRNVVVGDDDLGKIVRAVAKELRLEPSGISPETKGADTVRRTLSNLGQLSQGLAELRNLYGTGHGRTGSSGPIKPRHAKLAVGAAATLATFLLETHIEQGTGT